MAGYHYKLQVVPKSYCLADDGKNYWEHEQPRSEMLVKYKELLPKNISWGDTEEFRSDENYSVLQVWWEDGVVESVQFEYSPTETKDVLLEQVLSLCIKYGYVLYSEFTKLMVEPDKALLWDDLKKSHLFGMYEKRMSEFQ
jgi:hypothetical protein